jgi:hypothetical protein
VPRDSTIMAYQILLKEVMHKQSLPTFFAPAERAPIEQVMAEREEVESFGHIKNILGLLPCEWVIFNNF